MPGVSPPPDPVFFFRDLSHRFTISSSRVVRDVDEFPNARKRVAAKWRDFLSDLRGRFANRLSE